MEEEAHELKCNLHKGISHDLGREFQKNYVSCAKWTEGHVPRVGHNQREKAGLLSMVLRSLWILVAVPLLETYEMFSNQSLPRHLGEYGMRFCVFTQQN